MILLYQVEKTAVLEQGENATRLADSNFCSYSKSEEIKNLKENIENAKNETKAANIALESLKNRSQEISQEYQRLQSYQNYNNNKIANICLDCSRRKIMLRVQMKIKINHVISFDMFNKMFEEEIYLCSGVTIIKM